ncbi:endonuclease/exonuclease/phosphatase family protein [Streptomyces sp. NPDC003758]
MTTDPRTQCPEATGRPPRTWRSGSPRTLRPGALSRAGRVNVAARLRRPQAERSEAAEHVGKAVAADASSRVVVLGDLNGTTDDGELAPSPPDFTRSRPPPAPASVTYPASFPVVRIDQILLRGVEPHRSWVLPANGSDHFPAASGISW